MNFELRNVRWNLVPKVDENLINARTRPIFSTVTDQKLADIVLGEVGLKGGGFASVDLTKVYDLEGGRAVEVSALRPTFLGDIMPPEEKPSRWFIAGGHVIKLSRQRGTSCYSDNRLQAAARIFGPLA